VLWATGTLLVALAAGLAYGTLLAAASATLQPIVLDYREPIVYGGALPRVQGEPPYQPIDRHDVTATMHGFMFRPRSYSLGSTAPHIG
jgi:hypothetical protein